MGDFYKSHTDIVMAKSLLNGYNRSLFCILAPWYNSNTPFLYIGDVGALPTGAFCETWLR